MNAVRDKDGHLTGRSARQRMYDSPSLDELSKSGAVEALAPQDIPAAEETQHDESVGTNESVRAESSTWRRGMPWVLGAILVGWVAIEAKSRFFPPTSEMRLLTVPVRVADVEQTVLASGVLQPKQLVSVGAQASGRIEVMNVVLGEHVVKGQLIAQIDPSTERNALNNADAMLAQERAQRASRAAALRQAELVFNRATKTYSQRVISQADYDTAEANYEGAKADVIALDAQIRQAMISVDTARVTLGFTKVVSPMDGTVVAIVAPEGQTVNAVQAAPTLVKIADLETMTVKAHISEADVTSVKAGQTVYFTILGAPEHRYYAKLRAIEPAPESMAVDTAAAAPAGSAPVSSAVYYNGLFEIENASHELRPSMTVQVNIVLGHASRALSIPTVALGASRSDGRHLVRVSLGKNKVEGRWVRTGINDGVIVEVLDGVGTGDQVVVGDAPSGGGGARSAGA